MTPAEAAHLLGVAAAYNRRKVGAMDAHAWAEALPDLTLADCQRAVIAHYGSETDYLMPGHVRRLVNTELARQRPTQQQLPELQGGPRPPWFQAAYLAARDERRALEQAEAGPLADTVDGLAEPEPNGDDEVPDA